MPPRREAAAAATAGSSSRKRALPAAAAATAAAAAPPARRQKKAAAAAADEQTTTATVFEFDDRWAGPVKEMYKDRELHDVVLSAGDVSVAAHRVILAAASPHLRGLFRGEMADSRARDVELQEVDGRALQQIVDFAYTGKIELAGSTVVAIIQAANLLQVTAVEAAAVEFLADRLDPGNCFSAMGLGLHLSDSAAGRELHDRSMAFMCDSFGPVVSDPSFLEAEAEAVASLVDRDELAVAEEEVFDAVVRWVKADEVARTGALDRLLPLVRFPLMKPVIAPLVAEPLFMQHLLAAQLLVECHPEFGLSAAAAGCRRLQPRRGTTSQGVTPVFVAGAGVTIGVTEEGRRLTGQGSSWNGMVRSGTALARGGTHYAEFELTAGNHQMIGVATAAASTTGSNAYSQPGVWFYYAHDGRAFVDVSQNQSWTGKQKAAVGDKVGLLVDLSGAASAAGSITVYKNGAKLGVMHTGADLLQAELHWAMCLNNSQASVVVQPAATPPK